MTRVKKSGRRKKGAGLPGAEHGTDGQTQAIGQAAWCRFPRPVGSGDRVVVPSRVWGGAERTASPEMYRVLC